MTVTTSSGTRFPTDVVISSVFPFSSVSVPRSADVTLTRSQAA